MIYNDKISINITMSTNTIKLKCLIYSYFQICSVDDVKVID